jgi:hypothetical protein
MKLPVVLLTLTLMILTTPVAAFSGAAILEQLQDIVSPDQSVANPEIIPAADMPGTEDYTGPCGGSYSCYYNPPGPISCNRQHRPVEFFRPEYRCFCERASTCN